MRLFANDHHISVLSQRAGWLLYQRFRGALVQATIDGKDCDTTAIFEKLCSFYLIVGGTFSVCDMKWKKRKKRVKHIHIPPASSVIRVKPSQTEKDTHTVFVQLALLGIESMRADYEVSETFEPKQKKQKLGGLFIILSDGYSPSIAFLNTTGYDGGNEWWWKTCSWWIVTTSVIFTTDQITIQT
jgi:hypothetical protein